MSVSASPSGWSARGRRALDRAVRGDRRWGALEVQPSRNGVVRYRLTVYPPGTSPTERAAHRVWRAWPFAGFALWILEMLLLGVVLSTPAAFWGASVLSVVSTVVLARLTRRRPRPRVLVAARAYDLGGPVVTGPYDDVRRASAELETADAMLRDGRITPVRHELLWRSVWDGLGAALPRAPRLSRHPRHPQGPRG